MPPEPVTGRPGRVAALLLAAGLSRRMAEANKLLLEVDGRPMVAVALSRLLASRVDEVVVVTGYQGDRVRSTLQHCLDSDEGGRVRLVHNERYPAGLGASLAAGVHALPGGTDGLLVCLADMPLVDGTVIDALLDAFRARDGASICVPVYRGRRGNPVLWPSEFFAELGRLEGDVGGRPLLAKHAQRLQEVSVGNEGVLVDVDTPAALASLREREARET